MIRLLLAIVLSAFLSQLYAAVPSTITIRGEIPWVNIESYTPIIVYIESNKDQAVYLEAKNGNLSCDKTVQVKAGLKQSFSLLLPSSLSDLSYAQVHWKSEDGQKGTARCGSTISYRDKHAVIIERDNTIVSNDFLNDLPEPRYSYSSSQRYQDMSSNSIPTYWQGIPLWICPILTPSSEKKLSNAQRDALKLWQRAGGNLFVSTKDLQNTWKRRGVYTQIANGNEGNKLYAKAIGSVNNQVRNNISQYKVPGTDDVPTAAFISILIIFIVIVGPLNYLWVRKHRQIHLFLITTPIISFIFCITLGISGILADGLASYRSVIELTWIDQNGKHACTWNSISWFSGMNPGTISLDNNSELRILDDSIYDNHYYYNDDKTKNLRIEWNTQQQASGEWIISRTHQQVQISTPRTEERRFIIKKNDKQFLIQNGFDLHIKAFEWYDDTGKRWIADDIASGQSKALKISQQPIIKVDKSVKRFSPHIQNKWFYSGKKFHFKAMMDKPLRDTPGPNAEDIEAPIVLVCGNVEVTL